MWLAVAAVGCVGGLVGHVLTRAVPAPQTPPRNKAVQLPSSAPLDLEEALHLLKERHAALEVGGPGYDFVIDFIPHVRTCS